MFADIYHYQFDQFTRLLGQDFITAARAWGDSIWKHAKRSIGLGLLSQWNALVGTIFTSTIIVEYYFQIQGLGYALHKYFIEPNVKYPEMPVESEFFMAVSSTIIITVLTLGALKDLLIDKYST